MVYQIKLDKFEGAPVHYQKEIITVNTEDGPVNAIVYIANPNMIRENLKPSQEYLNHLLGGKDLLTESYYSVLSKIETI